VGSSLARIIGWKTGWKTDVWIVTDPASYLGFNRGRALLAVLRQISIAARETGK